MAPVRVAVSGTAQVKRRPEQGVVTVRVQATGPEQAAVSADVRRTVLEVQAQVRKLTAPRLVDGSPSAAVTHWASGALATRSYWEYREDGHSSLYGAQTHLGITSGYSSDSSQHEKRRRRVRVYEAEAAVTATFRDLDVLSDFTTAMSLVPLASVCGVEWQLTDETRARLRDDAVARSYRDALAKARAVADAMDRRAVRPVEVRLAADSPPLARGLCMAPPAPAAGGPGEGEEAQELRLTYQPEDVAYDVDCDVTFDVE